MRHPIHHLLIPLILTTCTTKQQIITVEVLAAAVKAGICAAGDDPDTCEQKLRNHDATLRPVAS